MQTTLDPTIFRRGNAATTSPAADRFTHIETLRTVSALLMVTTHVWEDDLPVARGGVDPDSPSWVRSTQIGFVGVLVFFAVSGFVIDGTLRGPRVGVGRRFVVSRFSDCSRRIGP